MKRYAKITCVVHTVIDADSESAIVQAANRIFREGMSVLEVNLLSVNVDPGLNVQDETAKPDAPKAPRAEKISAAAETKEAANE